MACKEATASVLTPDQITHDNRISVDGGSKNIQNPNLRMWFVMKKAVVKYDEKNYVISNKKDYDIGVATGPSAFNPQTSQLMNQHVFYTTPTSLIGPICLGKETDEVPQCHLTTVGWGKAYTENPSPHPEDASLNEANKHYGDFTSCTTNGIGPNQHRYKQCDLDSLKQNGWKCMDTSTSYPDGYHSGECSILFKKFDDQVESKKIPWDLSIKEYEFRYQGRTETCYRSDTFKDGYCLIKGYQDKTEWGFCDTACKHVAVCYMIMSLRSLKLTAWPIECSLA